MVTKLAGSDSLEWQVEETGHFQNFKPRVVGRVVIAAAGTHRLMVQPAMIAKNAACDIRQVRLLPVEPPK